jgi:phage shock protein A
MTHAEDLLRLKSDRISAMEKEITKLENKIEFLEAQLEIAKQVTFNN